VAADVKNVSLTETVQPMLYLPVAQNYAPDLRLLAGSAAGGGFAARLREVVLQLDPGLALTPVQSLTAYTAIGLLPQRLASSVSTLLGLLAVLLSALGIYGVIAHMVAQQTREIGVRMALGAQPRDVIRLVLRRMLRLTGPGLAAGIVLGVAMAFAVRGFLLGVAPVDPVAFVLAPLLLLGIGVLAAWQPARRAAAVQPGQALRSD
jgi:ABC-type antimicrobial peptide transport system permease subunit